MSSNESSSQAPTVITALFNPMMGHISAAYAARVSRDLSLASRFDFNIYSYESQWTMGAEWWMRHSQSNTVVKNHATAHRVLSSVSNSDDVYGVVKARASTNNVRGYDIYS